MEDCFGGLFHVEGDGFHAADEKVVARVGGDSGDEARRGGEQSGPEAAGERADFDQRRSGLQSRQHLKQAEYGAEQSEHRQDLCKGDEQVGMTFESRNLPDAGLPNGPSECVPIFVAMQQGGSYEVGGRARGLVADGNGLEVVAAAEVGGDSVQEIINFDLGAVQMKKAFEENDQSDKPARQNEPHDCSAGVYPFQHKRHLY